MNVSLAKLDKATSHSLVGLIQSMFFRDFYIVTYLYDKIHHDHIVEELLNRFQSYPYDSQQEFIPFLIFVAIKFKSKIVKEWMAKQCQRGDVRLYLMVKWATASIQEVGSEETFIDMLDCSAINGKLACSLDDMTEQQIHLWIMKKSQKSNYLPILMELYHKLTNVCFKLKKDAPAERNQRLRHYLQKYISAFQEKMQQTCQSPLFGFDFPHPSASNYVVNVNLEECICFSTKERVPYRLVFETVDFEELTQYEQSEKGSGSTSDVSHGSESDSKEDIQDRLCDLQTQERDLAMRMSVFIEDKKDKKKLQTSKNQSSSEDTKMGSIAPEESWDQMVCRIKESSKFNNFKSLQVRAYVVKSGDDLRQEAFAMQLIKIVKSIFAQFNLKLWVRTYDIIMTSANSGFIEFIPNTCTISQLKKRKGVDLSSVFHERFSSIEDTAAINFTNSLAGYCILQYLFLIKDRHNGNIMLDSEGHIIHIDFGFLLGSSPGNMNFEGAPFKFPGEYLRIMGGQKSDFYQHFKEMLFVGFTYIRRYAVDIMKFISVTKDIVNLRCFDYYKPKDLEYRFMLGFTDEEVRREIEVLLGNSLNSGMTMLYDRFQCATNSIFY